MLPNVNAPAPGAEAWLQSLLSAGARGGALLLLAALVTLALARRSASARHLVWAAGLAGLGLVTALGPLLPAWHVEVLPPPALSAVALAGEGAALAQAAAAATTTTAVAGAPIVGAAEAVTTRAWWPAALLALWGAGALALLLRLALGLRAAARLVRGAAAVDDPGLRTLAAVVAARTGWRGPIDLRMSPAIASPVTAGILRPVVLLPTKALGWPAERLRAVLAHELGHVRRHDCMSQLLARLITAVHWWNPLCWLAERRMVVERERACDDHVLADGTRASSYAGHLLEIGRQVLATPPRQRPAVVPGAFMVGCSRLADRVETLLDAGRSHRLPGRQALALALGATLLLALPAACLTGDPLASEGATRLVYWTEPATRDETAKVLARRLEEMGLPRSRVTPQGKDRLVVELPPQPRAAQATTRAALERRGTLALTLVVENDRSTFTRLLGAHAWGDPEARRLGIQGISEHARGDEDGRLAKVDSYLLAPRPALRRYLASLPETLLRPAGSIACDGPTSSCALVLEQSSDDNVRTRLVDRRQGLRIGRVLEARALASSPGEPEWASGALRPMFEVNVTLAPADAARLHALTSANIGRHLAIELDDGEVWGAPVIRAAISDRVSLTARGSRAEAERLAASLRAGALPASLELVDEEVRP
jgi:beta-lactamase regulating signal transducer with metallopeptidase domain